jgi:hypothetical protein
VFSDYHDIEIKQDTLNGVGFKVKTSEIFYDDDDGGYWGLFYAGKMPSKKEIKFLIDIEKESIGY